MVCGAHQKYFEFYCEDTLTPLCVDCANESYKLRRTVVRLTEVEAKLKISMKTSNHNAQIKHKDLATRLASLHQARKHVESQASSAAKKIAQRRDFTFSMVQRIADSMIVHVQSTADQERMKIQDELDHIQESMRMVKKQHSNSRAVLQATPSIEFIKQAKVVLAEQENNQVLPAASPVQCINTLEFLPALTSTNDPSRAQVLIEDCLLGHLKRKSEELFMPSGSMPNLYDYPDGRTPGAQSGNLHHDESFASLASLKSFQLPADQDEESLGSEDEFRKTKSESDLREKIQHQIEHLSHFELSRMKGSIPPSAATLITAVSISNMKPALDGILDICKSSDGIWISGYYTPERWKTPHLCIFKLKGFDQTMELVFDMDAKDAARPSVLQESNGKLIYAKRKDWRIFEINPSDPKHRMSVTYSMVTQRIGALTGAGKHMFFSDVSPENHGCIQFLKWKEPQGLCYKKTIHTNVSTENHETVHLGLVCSPTSPVSDGGPEVCMLVVSDSSSDNKNVVAVDTDGNIHWQLAGHTSDLLKRDQADLDLDPAGVCADLRCNVYVVDRANHRVLVVTPNGKNIFCLLGRTQGIQDPSKICLAMDGQQLAVVNKKGTEIALYDIDVTQ